MEIVEKKVKDLIPYEKNPRRNDDAVEAVAASIRQFGFKVPIVIDGNNVIVAGHTRLKAAKRLHLASVPVIVADDLTDEQIKAFRLADNKVSELADWDFDLLGEELGDIFDIDMTEFGFSESEEEEEDGYFGDERERTYNAYNLKDYDAQRTTGPYDLPVLKRCDFIPTDLIGFNYVLSDKKQDKGVHFFLDDYQFERIWNDPQTYITKFLDYPCVLTPDFSLYADMPMAMKIWNVYRSRLIGQMMQDYGITVIPTLQLADERTFDFVFDGIEGGGTVAVSTVGVMKDKDAFEIWKQGMRRALDDVKPKTVVCYGTDIDFDFSPANVVKIKSRKLDSKNSDEVI